METATKDWGQELGGDTTTKAWGQKLGGKTRLWNHLDRVEVKENREEKKIKKGKRFEISRKTENLEVEKLDDTVTFGGGNPSSLIWGKVKTTDFCEHNWIWFGTKRWMCTKSWRSFESRD